MSLSHMGEVRALSVFAGGVESIRHSKYTGVLQGILENGFLNGGENETNVRCVRCLSKTMNGSAESPPS